MFKSLFTKGLNCINGNFVFPLFNAFSEPILGCFNAIVTTPLWVVNTRLKLQGTNRNPHEHPFNQPTKLKGLVRK